MSIIRKAPVLFLLLPVMGGILYGLFLGGISYGFTFSCILISFFLLLISLQKSLGKLYSIRWIQGFLVSFCCFFAGVLAATGSNLSLRENFYTPSEKDQVLLLSVETPAQEKERSYKFTASIEKVLREDKWQSASGKTLIYLSKQDSLELPQYGDLILIKPALRQITPPRNPYEFDYSRYMQLQNVYYQAFLKNGEWQRTGENEGYYFRERIYAFTNSLVQMAELHIHNREELGVFKALLLGEKSDLLPHVQATYSGTGTMHVLAVSGLHVGILFMIFSLTLSFLIRNKYSKILRLLIILAVLWIYAFITGLSPSVMRSTAMFSLMVMGLELKRISNIYNSMAASALVLLLFEPQLILNVGFQLSYIAVIGIIWLQPKIYAWIKEPHRKVPKYIWGLISTTLAAQLATFPLGLLYFHQFPTLFLFSNLVAIPYVFVLMCGGVGFFMINAFDILSPIAKLYNYLLELLIKGLNELMFFFDGLPKSSLKGLHIDLAECFLIYGLIILFSLAFIQRKKAYLHYSLGLLLVFGLWHGNKLYAAGTTDELVIYSVPKRLALSVKENDKVYVLADSAFLANDDNIKFHIEPYLISSRAEDVIFTDIKQAHCSGLGFCINAPYSKAGDKNFLIVDNAENVNALKGDTAAYDFIILTNSPKIKITELNEALKFGRIILSPNNKGYLCRQWISECKELGVSCTNMYDSNSLTIKL